MGVEKEHGKRSFLEECYTGIEVRNHPYLRGTIYTYFAGETFPWSKPCLNLYVGLLFRSVDEGRNMNFTMAGVILFTHKYEECVDFYGQTLGLDVLHRIDRVGERLTTFMLGNSYLMVETGGVEHEGKKTVESSPIKFRFNVPDVKVACAQLRSKGLKVDVFDHTWGTTAEFSDPDGNLCALRSDEGFGD